MNDNSPDIEIEIITNVERNGGGTTDYNYLDNKPSINGVTLIGNKTTEDLGIVSEESDPTVPEYVKEITQEDIASWNNKAEKSEIPDVSNFITNTVDNLVNYYTKTETDNKLSSIPKFDIKPVDELPTENISNTSIYLLKVGTDSPTLYEEYIYVNGAWELLGTARVDLTDYVKNTDYATSSKAGVVKVKGEYGVVNYNDKGEIGITSCPDENIITKKGFYAIQPKNIDLATKVGLTTNTLELSEDEKAEAQKWLGVDATYIKKTGDVLEGELAIGVNRGIKTGLGSGTFFFGEYGRNILGWDYSLSTGGTSPGLLIGSPDQKINFSLADELPYINGSRDYVKTIVKNGLTTNTIELTEEEKASAQNWLGVTEDIESLQALIKDRNQPLFWRNYTSLSVKEDGTLDCTLDNFNLKGYQPSDIGKYLPDQISATTVINAFDKVVNPLVIKVKEMDAKIGDINSALESLLGV